MMLKRTTAKIPKRWLLWLALVLLYTLFNTARAQTNGMLRVLLTRLGSPDTIRLTANCEYILQSETEFSIPENATATITAKGNTLMLSCNDQQVTLSDSLFLIRAGAGHQGIQFIQPELSNLFCGDLWLFATDGVITGVLNIYVEEYLYGTIGYTMPPSAEMDALEALSVAARTNVLNRMNGFTTTYDLTDSSILQFRGFNSSPEYLRVIEAVDETRGGVLYYGDQPALCFLCLSNGGQTEATENAGGPSLPYSVMREDEYDLHSKTALVNAAIINKNLSQIDDQLLEALAGEVRLQLEEFQPGITSQDFHIESIESITACESRFPPPSRLYKSLTFKLSVSVKDADGQPLKGDISVSIPTYGGIEDWYQLSINPEDNETIWVTESDSAFTVAFRREGTGLGLSVRGAQVMAERHVKAADILAFYYPGTEGRRLTFSVSTQDLTSSSVPIATARLIDKTDLLEAPEDQSASVATIAAGVVVDIYGVREKWAAVSSGNKRGYIQIDALTSIALYDAMDIQAQCHANKKTLLLSMPDEDSPAIEQIGVNQPLSLVARNEQWAMVEFLGISGFVALADIALDSQTDIEEMTEEDSDVPDAFVEADGDVFASLRHDAPLFEFPNELSTVLQSLKQGEQVQVLAYSRDWARIQTLSGREGCVRQESLTTSGEKASSDGSIHRVKGTQYLYVSRGVVRLYARWSEESPVLDFLYYGEQVRLGAYNDTWACVRINGITGYAPMETLSQDPPPAIDGGPIARLPAGISGVLLENASACDAPVDGRELFSLIQGQRVSIVAMNQAWAVTQVDGAAAYIPLHTVDILK